MSSFCFNIVFCYGIIAEVLEHHLLPNVICSGVIEGKVHTVNSKDQIVNFTRTDDGKLFVGDAQIIASDIIGTNGVIHFVDTVLIPDDGLFYEMNILNILNITLVLLNMEGLKMPSH